MRIFIILTIYAGLGTFLCSISTLTYCHFLESPMNKLSTVNKLLQTVRKWNIASQIIVMILMVMATGFIDKWYILLPQGAYLFYIGSKLFDDDDHYDVKDMEDYKMAKRYIYVRLGVPGVTFLIVTLFFKSIMG